jgi:GNAT superfamily N-acetyltransferase
VTPRGTPTREHCGCGADRLSVEFDKRRHSYRHREWAKGILLARTVAPKTANGILHVTPETPIGERKLAYRMARVAQRTHKWDFATFPHPTRLFVEGGPDAFLYLKDRHTIGYLVAVMSPAWIPADPKRLPRVLGGHLWPRPAEGAEFRQEPVRCVNEVFVAADHRGEGIGTALVRAALEAYGLEVGELAFGGPFTKAGLALARRFAVDGLIRVGA